MRLRPLTCGWLTGPLEGFFAGETGRIRVPVLAWLVEHPKGTLLFDAGMHPDVAVDPAGRLGPLLSQMFDTELTPEETIGERLRVQGVDPDRVDLLVTSHLHFDHAGGNAAIPNATVVVQRREWEAGADPDLARRSGFDPKDYDTGHDLRLVEGEHDVFGDGRVVCLPTHGHTPGHQSLRVKVGGRDVVLSSDACYARKTLEELALPGVLYDREQMLASLHRLRALRDAGAEIYFGHDPEQWQTLPPLID